MRRMAIAVLALTGCASAPRPVVDTIAPRMGAVGVLEMTEAVPDSARLKLAERETFQMPLAEGPLATPAYPEALLAQQLPPQVVCLRVGIGADGRVMGTWPNPEVGSCPSMDAIDQRFVDAAITATADWRFDPAFRCVYPDAEAKDRADGLGCMGGREVAEPVSLAYRFVFEQHDGRGSVRLGD